MATRRQAREWALQLLVQLDLNPAPLASLDATFADFWRQVAEVEDDCLEAGGRAKRVLNIDTQDPVRGKSLAEAKAFAEDCVRGVMTVRDKLDRTLEPRLRNWSLYRLGTVERNVLRLGIWELQCRREIPAPIVINECVDLAKFFSETKSGRFVNGILDALARDPDPSPAGDAATFTP